MDVPAFLAILPANGYSSEDSTLLQKAITLAAPHLALQKRLSGESIFQHNLRVAEILCDLHADAETLAASLLHGLAPEEYLSVERELGVSVIALLKGLDGLKELKFKNNKLSAEALRKIILTTVSDVRIITIKLANKIDNLSTLGVFPENEQRRIASEVLDIYAPLAYRLGLEKLRVRLEDAAFKMINPRKYKEIQDFLEDSREQREQLIEESITLINSIAEQKIPIVKIKGRSKHIYSIYRKMTGRGVKLNEQYDLLGIRVIVPTEKDCYTLLGLLHEKLEPVEERLKDYIANPKPNLYRSIHTAVLLPNGRNLEIQIRTPEMDEFAEEGLAAHWRYKGLKSDQIFEKKMAWLKSILELQKTTENKEFLETIKVDLFGDTIYCYTPKGDIKELPRGAVLLDFAYTIHEEVGNHAVGGRVNGIFVPLKHPLASGDVIDILTNKNQRPRRSWIKIVTSPKSRQKIRKELKTTEHLSPFHFRQIKPATAEEQGILVHAAKEEGRWLPVQWKETFNRRIRFVIQAQERSGLLADMLHTIASAGFEVKEAKAKLLDENLVECSFVIIPRSLEQIQELIGRLRKVRGWKKIYFA